MLFRSSVPLERNKRGCNKRWCKSNKYGNMQILPNLREICAKIAQICANLRKFAKLFLQKMRKFARNLRPRLLRYRLLRSKGGRPPPPASRARLRPLAAPLLRPCGHTSTGRRTMFSLTSVLKILRPGGKILRPGGKILPPGGKFCLRQAKFCLRQAKFCLGKQNFASGKQNFESTGKRKHGPAR